MGGVEKMLANVSLVERDGSLKKGGICGGLIEDDEGWVSSS